MSTYIISDLHGHYDEFLEMLRVIAFTDEDMLYVLGDVVDRGPKPVTLLKDLMNRPNVVCLAGNHELMALECLNFLLKEVTEENIYDLDEEMLGKLLNWQLNGSGTTLDEFAALSPEERDEVLDYLGEFDLYEEIELSGRKYLLIHAGLRNFEPDRPIEDYEPEELVWERPDYDIPYFDDVTVVTGHTPTLFIETEENIRPGFILKANNHIAIDCGCGIPGGRLACLRLDDQLEFYVDAFEEYADEEYDEDDFEGIEEYDEDEFEGIEKHDENESEGIEEQ